MGIVENRCRTELRDYREAFDNNVTAAKDQTAAVIEKYQQLRKRYGKLKDAYQEWGERWKSDDEVSYRTPPSVRSCDLRDLGDFADLDAVEMHLPPFGEPAHRSDE
jgi:hypothetical protein